MKMSNTIVVLGGDGYLGWPLSLKLALKNPDQKIIIADNEFRRNQVIQNGSDSILPILKPAERIGAFKRIYGQNNLEFVSLNVNSDGVEKLFADEKPHTVYHLAQQCSAPFSMKNIEQALFTIQNNEIGNMRVLWAVRQHIPDAHLIKLGSFGEYAKGGIDVAEGYFYPEYNGKKATEPLPYPRESDDIYHITKINDSNFVSLACRKWGLRITDIMQSTVFGSYTEEIGAYPELHTRFDYDEMFGTVLNRFMAQMMVGNPLTVYGTGLQRTGLMALNDSINSLSEMFKIVSPKGVHKVINHVTVKSYCINEIAEVLKTIGEGEGLEVKIQKDTYDPRIERPAAKMEYQIETGYLADKIEPTPLEQVVRQTLKMIRGYKDRISPTIIPPVTQWTKEPLKNSGASALIKDTIEESTTANTIGSSEFDVENEEQWVAFKEENFTYNRINLNPGTLGTPSKEVIEAIKKFLDEEECCAFPLRQYQKAREALDRTRALAMEIWPSTKHDVTIAPSASQCSNLLSLAIARTSKLKSADHIRVLTTLHEHYGGIKAFQKMSDYEVHYLTDNELYDEAAFLQKVDSVKPHICLFSHVCYDTAQVLPVENYATLVKELFPDCKVIIDVAQSIGIYDMPFRNTDVIFGSAHKLLFGPQGAGFLWTTKEFRTWVGGMNWGGEGIDMDDFAGFSIPGGQNFSVYAGMEAALKLYKKVGGATIRRRASYLANYFKEEFLKLISSLDVEAYFAAPSLVKASDGMGNKETSAATFIAAFKNFDPYDLYNSLNEKGVHVKCIKDREINGVVYHILRFGFPYFESKSRIKTALQKIEAILLEGKPELKEAV